VAAASPGGRSVKPLHDNDDMGCVPVLSSSRRGTVPRSSLLVGKRGVRNKKEEKDRAHTRRPCLYTVPHEIASSGIWVMSICLRKVSK